MDLKDKEVNRDNSHQVELVDRGQARVRDLVKGATLVLAGLVVALLQLIQVELVAVVREVAKVALMEVTQLPLE